MNGEFLSYRDFVPYAPNTIDETTKINHTHCTAGEDTRERLYIKRISSNKIVAWCHNCGRKGVYFRNDSYNTLNKEDLLKKAIRKSKGTSAGESIGTLPHDLISIQHAPPEVRSWLFQYGLGLSEIERYKIHYSPSKYSIYIPIHDAGLSPTKPIFSGYVQRSFNVNKPKYIKQIYKGSAGFFYAPYSFSASTVVVVEDCISAIKCSRLVDSVAILGTNANDKLYCFLSTYDNIILFLDDDNPTVKKQTLKILKKFNFIKKPGQTIRVYHSGGKDPKEHSMTELEGILTV